MHLARGSLLSANIVAPSRWPVGGSIMLLELTTALNIFLHSSTSQAQKAQSYETLPRAVTLAQELAKELVPTTQSDPSAASGEAATATTATATTLTKNKSRRRGRRNRHRASATATATNSGGSSAAGPKKLPPYQGSIKRETGPLTRYNDPTDVPLPGPSGFGAVPANTPGQGEVSEADLAPGPIIKNAQVSSSTIGQDSTTELDPSERSLLRFGLHGGESLTKYKSLDPNAKEGALLVGAQLGLATDLWDDLQIFGIPLSGEENLRLDYVTSFDSGVAQMIQMRIDSVLFLGPDLDNERGFTPLVGIGFGWANAELRSIANSTQSARTHAQGLILVPQVGARWRFVERAALDLKIEPLFATDSKLCDFGKLGAQLGLLIFI